MSSRIEKTVVEEPPQKPTGEELFEIVRGPASGTRESGLSYTEWRIYVTTKAFDALYKEHSRVVCDEGAREYYERCIITGLSLEDALKATENRIIR